MFSTAADASKVALHGLVRWLRNRNVELIDCQVASDHLFTLGARLIPRAEFIAQLERGIPAHRPGRPCRRHPLTWRRTCCQPAHSAPAGHPSTRGRNLGDRRQALIAFKRAFMQNSRDFWGA